MRFFSKLTFRAKIGFGTLLIVVLSALVSGLPSNRMAQRALIEESKKRGQALAFNISLRAVDSVLSLDFLRLKNMVDEIKAVDPDIDYAFILDGQGRVLAHTFRQGFPVELKNANRPDYVSGTTHIQLLDTGKHRIYDFATPVLVDNVPIGSVRIGLSRTKVQQEVNRFLLTMAAFSGGALVIAILAGTLFAARVSRRINVLRSYAESLVTGELEPDIGFMRHNNCWEVNDCNFSECPAYGDTRRRCWYLAGTLCPNCGPEEYPEKLESCLNCPVYRQNRGDEIQDLADTFDVMALSLKNHIQELRKADKEIRRQGRLMRTILDVTPDLVSLQDADLVYQGCNKAFSEYVGLHKVAEVAGMTDRELFKRNGNELLSEKAELVLKTGKGYQQEVRGVDGEREYWFHVVLIPVEEQDGRVVGVLRAARDISEVKQVQAQLVQAQKMESLGKLAGGVAHEINTPLGIILGYAQLLQDDVEQDGQVQADLKVIEKQTRVCGKIVADLLGFSRQNESAKREMCFNNSLMEAISLVRHTFQMDKVEIVTDLDDRMPIIYGDPEKLKQVWINLLNNARDAMEGGGVVAVTSRLNYAERRIVASVADIGSGISKEDLKRVFDPFFTTKSVGCGTGLGLSVSFGIIKDHKGAIRAESPVNLDLLNKNIPSGVNRGPGSMITVDLPLDHGSEAETEESGKGRGEEKE